MIEPLDSDSENTKMAHRKQRCIVCDGTGRAHVEGNEEVCLEDGRLTVTFTTTYDAVADLLRSPPSNTHNKATGVMQGAGPSAGNGGAGWGAALLKTLPKLQ